MSKKRLYLSGPMTGYEDFNYPAFHEAAERLQADGWEVFNPAESFAGDTTKDRTEYMRHDLAEVTRCTHIAVLDDWFNSRGARAEMRVAMECGLDILNAKNGTAWSNCAVERIRSAVAADYEFSEAVYPSSPSEPVSVESQPSDSGTQQFASGAIRDDQSDKTRPELISPFASYRLGLHLAAGAKKYADRNWEKGIPLDRIMASTLRHADAFRRGETDEDHLAAAYCNLMFMLDIDERIQRGLLPEGLNDMPVYKRKVSLDKLL